MNTKATPKKVNQPFGSPNHSKHAYSEFSHLTADIKSFAVNLALTKEHVTEETEDAEVVELPKRRRTASRSSNRPKPVASTSSVAGKKPKKSGDGDSVTEDGEEEKDQEDEGYQPCTMIPCMKVVQAIADLQMKNENERLDLEDDAEHLTLELQQTHQEVLAAEGRLMKLNETGDQLEMNLTQIMNMVEALEKKNATLVDERGEINSKMMLLQVEKQKYNRRLEKAQKALADARWRKKKADQAQDAENGLSFPVSEIADKHIVRKDDATVKADTDVSSTSYNALARDQVVDLLERPPTLKTVPPLLQENFLVTHPDTFDKYAQKHYRQTIASSIESWESLQSTTIACDVRSHPKYPQYHHQKQSNSATNTAPSSPNGRSIGSPGGNDLHTSSMSTISRTAGTMSVQSLRKQSQHSHSGNQLNNPSVSQRVGQTLSRHVQQQQQQQQHQNREGQHRDALVSSMHSLVSLVQRNPQQLQGRAGFSLSSASVSSVFGDGDGSILQRPMSPSSRPATSVDSQTKRNGNNALSTSTSTVSVLERRLQYDPKVSKQEQRRRQKQQQQQGVRLSPLHLSSSSAASPGALQLQALALPLGQLRDSESLLSTLQQEYEEKLEQDGIFLPITALAHDQLDAQSMGAVSQSGSATNLAQLSSSNTFYSNVGPVEKKPQIDRVFFQSTAQTQWGRNHKLGTIRATPAQAIPHTVVHPLVHLQPGHGGEQSLVPGGNNKGGGGKGPKISYKTITGLTVVDMRQLPRLHTRVLTVEHPGMATFESATAWEGDGANAEDAGSGR